MRRSGSLGLPVCAVAAVSPSPPCVGAVVALPSSTTHHAPCPLHGILRCLPLLRRTVTIETGLLPQANGSARTRMMSSGTEVLAAVKAEVGAPTAGKELQGRLECSVECWSSASPMFEGRGAEEVNAELTRSLNRCRRVSCRVVHSSSTSLAERPFVRRGEHRTARVRCSVAAAWLTLCTVERAGITDAL